MFLKRMVRRTLVLQLPPRTSAARVTDGVRPGNGQRVTRQAPAGPATGLTSEPVRCLGIAKRGSPTAPVQDCSGTGPLRRVRIEKKTNGVELLRVGVELPAEYQRRPAAEQAWAPCSRTR